MMVEYCEELMGAVTQKTVLCSGHDLFGAAALQRIG